MLLCWLLLLVLDGRIALYTANPAMATSTTIMATTMQPMMVCCLRSLAACSARAVVRPPRPLGAQRVWHAWPDASDLT